MAETPKPTFEAEVFRSEFEGLCKAWIATWATIGHNGRPAGPHQFTKQVRATLSSAQRETEGPDALAMFIARQRTRIGDVCFGYRIQ